MLKVTFGSIRDLERRVVDQEVSEMSEQQLTLHQLTGGVTGGFLFIFFLNWEFDAVFLFVQRALRAASGTRPPCLVSCSFVSHTSAAGRRAAQKVFPWKRSHKSCAGN